MQHVELSNPRGHMAKIIQAETEPPDEEKLLGMKA